MASLFTLPIAPCNAHKQGTLNCTQPAPQVYLLTFTYPADNRLTSSFLKTILAALDILEFGDYKPGVVVTTSGISKFYSNGLDLDHVAETEGFTKLLYSVWARLLTYPMPTVALLNGHAFAGGLMLAMAHDYRLAPSPRGFLCVNELLFGVPLTPAMSALFRHKLTPQTYRTLVLEARRFSAAEAVSFGLADAVVTTISNGDSVVDQALKFVKERSLVEMPKTGIYGRMKADMYKDLLVYMTSPSMESEEEKSLEVARVDDERREFGKVWYEQWQKENKAKL